MEIYIFGTNRELVGVVESFEYFRWTRRYSHCGSFELTAPATPQNAALLLAGNYLWKNDDQEAGVIEHFELMQTDKESIKASGRFVTSFMARRIIWGTEILTADLSSCIGQLLNNHLIAPIDSSRQIPGVLFSSDVLGIPVNTQVSNRNLMDATSSLCDASNVGIKTVFDPSQSTFSIQLYKGDESYAVFSKEYENLTDQVYIQNSINYANTALIGGEGEGVSRIYAAITSETGENRREVFVDAKDLRQEDFGTGYSEALIFRGQNKLVEMGMIQTFDATVNPHGNLIYKVDYDLGQTVNVISNAWGLSLQTRITEIEESYDSTGLSLSIVFGKGILTLIQKLKGDF